MAIQLGSWQVERRAEKNALITQYNKSQAQRMPVEIDINNFDADRQLFQKIFLNGEYLHEYEIALAGKYLNNSGSKNYLGYHIITPFLLENNQLALVNRGWVSVADYKAGSYSKKSTRTDIYAVVRKSTGDAPWYMPHNNPQENLWFWIDKLQIENHLKSKGNNYALSGMVLQEIGSKEAKPRNIPNKINFYNQHMQYIVTWFTLALIIVIMWFFFLRGRDGTKKGK